MNLAQLEVVRNKECICGNKYLCFGFHDTKCPYFKTQLALQEQLLNSREEVADNVSSNCRV